MSGLCDGRVAIVTGAGRGIGRCHALELARQGATVVVNDLGVAVDGNQPASEPAAAVVAEIEADGGVARASGADVSDFEQARNLIADTVAEFGRLDVLVNNAGILRDRMIVSMTPEDWDQVMRVHLRGTFAPTHWAANHWREVAKSGELPDARIINTSSGSGLYGNIAQANYGAAKAGIASFTIIASRELGRYGVTVNAVAPVARTRMTEDLDHGLWVDSKPAEGEFDPLGAEHISPLVAWLASTESRNVTGQVFNVSGTAVSVAIGWTPSRPIEGTTGWEAASLGVSVQELLAELKPA